MRPTSKEMSSGGFLRVKVIVRSYKSKQVKSTKLAETLSSKLANSNVNHDAVKTCEEVCQLTKKVSCEPSNLETELWDPKNKF